MSDNEKFAIYDESHCLSILRLNNTKNINEHLAAIEFAQNNFTQMILNELFYDIEQEIFIKILESDKLNVTTEEVVFETAMKWLQSNNLILSENICSLIKAIRLQLLPVKYLIEKVEPVLYPIEMCRPFFIKALRWHIFPDETLESSLRINQKIPITKENDSSGRKLLSIGSEDLNTANIIEIYDEKFKKWIQPNKLAIYKRNFSVAIIDDLVMLIGGTHSADQDNEPINTVDSLNLKTGSLTTAAPLNDHRQYAAAVVVGKGKLAFLYILGGWGLNKILKSVERWDPYSRVWTFVTPMTEERTGLAAVFLNDSIYVLGGRIGSYYQKTMEAYNIENDKWERKASMTKTRAYFNVAAFKNHLYAVAGSESYGSLIDTVERYNPQNDRWTTIANILSKGFVGVSRLGNRLICSGGSNSTNVQAYDDINDQWLPLSNMNVSRSGYLIELPKHMKNQEFNWNNQVATTHKLLAIGTQDFDTSSSIEVYDDKIRKWTVFDNLNISKINYCVAFYDDQVLLIGGTFVQNSFTDPTNSVEKLDLSTGNVSSITPLNVHRHYARSVVIGKGNTSFVYVFGGWGLKKLLKSVERWDPVSNSWVFVSPMLTERTGHGTAILNNNIYVVGGRTTSVYLNTVEAYNTENDTWTTKTPLNNANAYFGITAFKNQLYVVGGNKTYGSPSYAVERYNPENDVWSILANISSSDVVGISSLGGRLICAGGDSSKIVEEYDELHNKWYPLPSLQTPRAGFLIELPSYIENDYFNWIAPKTSTKLLYLGSWDINTANKIEMFDTKDKKWSKLRDLPLNKCCYGVSIIYKKLLIIGGTPDDTEVLNTVNSLNLMTGELESIASFNVARKYPSSVVVQEGKKYFLYILGGMGSNSSLDSVERWDPSTGIWTTMSPMLSKRTGHGVVFLNGKIYVVGGRENSNFKNTMEAYNIKGDSWELKAPMNNIKGYFGITVFKDHIYVVGGNEKYGGGPVNTVEKYNPVDNSWKVLSNISSTGNVGLCSIGNKLIFAGGSDTSVQEYDENNDTWTPLLSLAVARHGFLVVLPEEITLDSLKI